jgi:hypothetical protein
MIESPIPATDVIENLRTRGKQWRASAVPEDLRKFKVETLEVTIDDLEFEMRWFGDVSPFYNPVIYGQVEPTINGSRIRAGFGISRRTIYLMTLYAIMAILPLLNGGTRFQWILAGFMATSLSFWAFHNRNDQPMRTRLVEVLATAATSSRLTTPTPTARPIDARHIS